MTGFYRATPRGGTGVRHRPLPAPPHVHACALYYIVNIIYYKLIHNIDYYSKYIVTTYIIYFTIRQKAIDTYGIIGS
jgi:hypothetical protein